MSRIDETYFVYIVECNDGTFYTGIAKDLESRVNKHNEGKGAKYTRSRIPVNLVYSETQESRSAALKREYEIKQWSRVEKLGLLKHKHIV
ncbi:GIY-YIG nuclease family protein [Candidatus Dojkabacteria bacterium]|uniref:GIY-YIG nuclease family protein n=1 Tax=Candidatus Dojkabacteria bacterium TaxID=2099670 RepID=A0A955RKS7_9BACT|nr:GIY-YIG nuclease family protein [Candidatus Dojkabacteria bacterium]